MKWRSKPVVTISVNSATIGAVIIVEYPLYAKNIMSTSDKINPMMLNIFI